MLENANALIDQFNLVVGEKMIEAQNVPAAPEKALWCRNGNHPFGEHDPDLQVLLISSPNSGEKQTLTLCGEHAGALMRSQLGAVESGEQ